MALQEHPQRDIEVPNSQSNLAAVQASEAVLGIAAATAGARETLTNGAIPFSILAVASHLIQGQPLIKNALEWQFRMLSTTSHLLFPNTDSNLAYGGPTGTEYNLRLLAGLVQEPIRNMSDFVLTKTPIVESILDAKTLLERGVERGIGDVLVRHIVPDMVVGGFAVSVLALISWAKVGRRMLGVLNRDKQ